MSCIGKTPLKMINGQWNFEKNALLDFNFRIPSISKVSMMYDFPSCNSVWPINSHIMKQNSLQRYSMAEILLWCESRNQWCPVTPCISSEKIYLCMCLCVCRSSISHRRLQTDTACTIYVGVSYAEASPISCIYFPKMHVEFLHKLIQAHICTSKLEHQWLK